MLRYARSPLRVVGPFWTLASDDWIDSLTCAVLAHFPGICCAVRLIGYTRTRYPHPPVHRMSSPNADRSGFA